VCKKIRLNLCYEETFKTPTLRFEKHKTGARPEHFSPFLIDFSKPQKCQNLLLVGVSTWSYRILFAINLRVLPKRKPVIIWNFFLAKKRIFATQKCVTSIRFYGHSLSVN